MLLAELFFDTNVKAGNDRRMVITALSDADGNFATVGTPPRCRNYTWGTGIRDRWSSRFFDPVHISYSEQDLKAA